MKRVLTWLLGVGVAYALLCAGLYFFQEKIFFHPKTLPADYRYAFAQPFEEVNLTPAPGVRLNGLFFPASPDSCAARGAVLYFHGNADNLVRWGAFAADFTRLHYDVWLFDYRTFGKSTGPLSEVALYKDARFCYDFLRTRYAESDLVLYGRSLGSGIATQLAAQTHPRLLLLETPYVSFRELTQHYLPWLPTRALLRYQFRTDAWLGRVGCPVHLFHGTDDWVVPYANSQKLLKIREKAQPGESAEALLTTLPGGGHKNLNTFAAYHAALAKVLR